MKTIYFVRHGESEANRLGLSAGSEFDTPLTDKGRQQARKTGQELKHKNIELIIASPLGRTVETAQIIANEIGYDAKTIVTSPLFIERGMGIYSKGPDEDYLKAATSGDPLHESVEPAQQMHERISEGLKWLESFKEKNILIVSHGGVSRILRLMHKDLPHSHMYKIERLPNAAIYEFTM
ncbi:MAG TPA: histidine phosphatase family protein [Candidatus Binatia bacterium]|nr:histidine phosphatase family protein [Candidatus Binatia bacterium]